MAWTQDSNMSDIRGYIIWVQVLVIFLTFAQLACCFHGLNQLSSFIFELLQKLYGFIGTTTTPTNELQDFQLVTSKVRRLPDGMLDNIIPFIYWERHRLAHVSLFLSHETPGERQVLWFYLEEVFAKPGNTSQCPSLSLYITVAQVSPERDTIDIVLTPSNML